jgi:hypothetical protein
VFVGELTRNWSRIICLVSLIPFSALAGQRPRSSSCVYGGWSRPQSFLSDSATRIDYAGVATGKNSTFIVGTIDLTFRRTVGTGESSPSLPSFLRAVTLSGESLGAPPGNFVFVYPRSAVDGQGNLHVVWGEPDSSSGVRSEETLGELPVTSLWHATWHQGMWSRPRLVYRRKGIQWELVQTSKLIATRSDLALAFPVHSAAAPGLVLLSFTGGVWKTREIPTPTGAVYADVVALDRGGFAVAYVAAALPPPGEHEGQESTVFVTTLDAAAIDWNEAVAVGSADQFPAFQPVLLKGESEELHVIWTQHVERRNVTTGLWHARSGNGGRTWISEPRLPLEVQVSRIAGVVDRWGTVHVAVDLHSSRANGPRVGYTRLEGGSWAPLTVLFPDRIGALPVMWSGVDGAPHMLFYDGPVIADSGRSMRPRITTLELR